MPPFPAPTPPGTPHLSVCIVNWNTRDDLRECLQALTKHPFMHGAQEVIVVDNGSHDGSAAMVAAEFPEAVLIANPANESYARGTNQALARATGDLLLLLNPDARVTPGALDTLAETLAAHPEVAAAAPRLVYEDGKTQPSVRGFPDPLPLLCDILKLSRLFPNSPTVGAYRMAYFDYDKPGPAPQPMASCFLIPRRVYETVGGMDERFPLFWNDVDWCLRARDAGMLPWYTPAATVVHAVGGTTTRTRGVRRVAVWESHRALLRLYHKHYRARTPRPLYALLTLLVTLGAWARTGRWGESLGKHGGETTHESLHRELERAG